jgi:hypothetical protein
MVLWDDKIWVVLGGLPLDDSLRCGLDRVPPRLQRSVLASRRPRGVSAQRDGDVSRDAHIAIMCRIRRMRSCVASVERDPVSRQPSAM